jgi:hypothetical protein
MPHITPRPEDRWDAIHAVLAGLGGWAFSNGEGGRWFCGQAASVIYLAVQPWVGITAMMIPRCSLLVSSLCADKDSR